MRALGTLLALLLALTACGGEENRTHTAADGSRFNDADVAFATTMIQHHAQALVLVDMLADRDVPARLEKLGEQILLSQGAEIETMTTWLTDWDRPIPETMRDHLNAGHGDEHGGHLDDDTGMGMEGMLSQEQLDALEAKSGSAFEKAWAEAMIEHHEGALDMAEEEVAAGLYKDAKSLAASIRKAQRTEIRTLQELAE